MSEKRDDRYGVESIRLGGVEFMTRSAREAERKLISQKSKQAQPVVDIEDGIFQLRRMSGTTNTILENWVYDYTLGVQLGVRYIDYEIPTQYSILRGVTCRFYYYGEEPTTPTHSIANVPFPYAVVIYPPQLSNITEGFHILQRGEAVPTFDMISWNGHIVLEGQWHVRVYFYTNMSRAPQGNDDPGFPDVHMDVAFETINKMGNVG